MGVGPGDPELLTMKAMKRLEDCNLVLYTGSLISEEVKDLFKGKESFDTSSMTMEEIIQKVKEGVSDGKRICIAHDGDPSIYGAISEEIALLGKEGIEAEIVPGVSSFQLSASLLGMELTCPGGPQSIIITRLPQRTKYERKMIVERNSTMVIFLSIHLVRQVQEELLRVFPPDFPAAVVYRAGWKDQLVLKGRISDLEDLVRNYKITKTALIIVSECLRYNGHERSDLYFPGFTHSFRKGRSP
ncbi:cobalt-precorrin-4 C(11)-methyltransferase [Metallosphaera hakonensis JCM 8857 = DSM 7519]|uniref:Cobalt-precorrin-4 C(11)-methyltransferase n=1 Tax=Metallosphaera hakonensis JCM 8857 = DSM 7519 TaxID=1293036 RepID=A0A2U9IX05_9CREN|nr:cobalt-precorrin-4 C(11)-methyltransferase [Metallosphaera hakonensis JCM 8857 = DSM 7519]